MLKCLHSVQCFAQLIWSQTCTTYPQTLQQAQQGHENSYNDDGKAHQRIELHMSYTCEHAEHKVLSTDRPEASCQARQAQCNAVLVELISSTSSVISRDTQRHLHSFHVAFMHLSMHSWHARRAQDV